MGAKQKGPVDPKLKAVIEKFNIFTKSSLGVTTQPPAGNQRKRFADDTTRTCGGLGGVVTFSISQKIKGFTGRTLPCLSE